MDSEDTEKIVFKNIENREQMRILLSFGGEGGGIDRERRLPSS